MYVSEFVSVQDLVSALIKSTGQSIEDVARSAGVQRPAVLEMIVQGKMRLPLDKVTPLARALGADERQLFKLALESWFDKEHLRQFEHFFSNGEVTAAEQSWLDFLRSHYGENLPELTPSLQRRLKLLVSLPG